MVDGAHYLSITKGPDSSADSCVLIIGSRIICAVASCVDREGRRGPPVVEGGAGPPGPIPNPVVKRASAGGYCGSNATGDAATAGGPRLFLSDRLYLPQLMSHVSRGGAAAARRAHNPKVGGSNPPPATTAGPVQRSLDRPLLCSSDLPGPSSLYPSGAAIQKSLSWSWRSSGLHHRAAIIAQVV